MSDDKADAPLTVGEEIRRLRKWRGMSLEALAGQAGFTKGYLSQIENGHAALDKRSTLHKIATALRVSPGDLTGDHYLLVDGADSASSAAHAAIPDIRLALLSTGLDDLYATPGRTVEELVAQAQQVAEWRQLCRDADVGRALPALLTDLHAAAAAGNDARPAALKSLVQAAHSTTLFLKSYGAVDLAWVAADRGHHAALLLDDPLYVAASEFARSQALFGLGAYQRAEMLARNAAELLGSPTSHAETEVHGMSVLVSAFATGVLGGDPAEGIREAQAAVEHTPGTNAFWLNFCKSNVDLWRIGIALEAGDPVLAAEVAATLNLDDIPAKSRRSSALIDHARALHALRGRDDDVIHLLLLAEKLATRTRHNLWAREIVGQLWLRSRRDAGGRELRGLAHRMGMLQPA